MLAEQSVVREGLLYTREPKARRAIISAHLPFVNSHNELCFIFMLHKNFQKRQISKKTKSLPSLKKNLFHISKAFISAFTIRYALLCFVLKSYKTKISFFHNSWHVMFFGPWILFRQGKWLYSSDLLEQRVFIFLWNLRI